MPQAAIGRPWNLPLKRDGGTGQAKLSIDGSGTPVEFILPAATDVDYDIHSMCFVAEFTGSIAIGNKFIMDTVATLTNGLFVEGKLSDTSFNFGNFKRTRDLVEVTQPQGGFNVIQGTTSLWQVFFWLPPYARLGKQGSLPPDDYIKATVRDDLSAFDFMEIFLQGVKV
jgi:hypothetical protein